MATKEQLRKLRQKFGLGEYSKRAKKKAVSSFRKVVKRKARKRVNIMARRKRVSHRRGIAGGLMGGGLIKSALVGIGTAHLSGYVPVSVPYKEEAAGALGAYMVGGKNIKSAVIGAAAVYLTKMASGQHTAVASGNY